MQIFTVRNSIGICLASLCLAACSQGTSEGEPGQASGAVNYGIETSQEVLVTSEAGDRIAPMNNVVFEEGQAVGTVISVDPSVVRQTMVGVGTSFTESSAFVLAHLETGQRRAVMEKIYGEDGANFSLARTPIGSTDFSVEGKYSYADVANDAALEHFSIAVDRDGFPRSAYPGIRDESFDLLPMIHEALAIKNEQQDKDLRIIASAWTAPPWMKNIEDWYAGGTPDTFGQGTGGELKAEYVPTYADYLLRYLRAYQAEGIDIWGLTPVNEPHGNSGQWESMHFTPETQRDFIRDHLGPKLRAGGFEAVKVLIYDQNRDGMQHWADVILGDPATAQFVYGTAVHWYESTNKVYEDVLAAVHDKFPDFDIIHTEGTIDDLGKPAPGGIADPVRFQESGWFGNDAFWWNDNATDWAYTAEWAPNVDDHPAYTPVHRYARNIIVSFNHWMSGWIDWNIVLDRHGGPNHVGNFCGAPIMIDVETGEVYYTPVFYVLAQLSRTIRPGDRAVLTTRHLEGLDDDALHASATINAERLLSVQLLNTTRAPMRIGLQVGVQFANVEVPANAVQTVRVQLH